MEIAQLIKKLFYIGNKVVWGCPCFAGKATPMTYFIYLSASITNKNR
jgi:hypothetical protein